MIHEGGLPVDLVVLDTLAPEGGIEVRAGGAPEYVLQLSHGWFHHLLDVVKYDPTNADIFAGTSDSTGPGSTARSAPEPT